MALNEIIGSREEEYGIDKSTATRIFHVEYAQRGLGYSLLGTRYPVDVNPFRPLTCKNVKIIPLPTHDKTTKKYAYAKITASYEWNQTDEEEKEIRQTVEFNTSVLSRDPGAGDFYLKLDGKTNDNLIKLPIGVQIPLIQFSIVKTYKQPKIPRKFAMKVGSVNAGPFQGWDAQKVLFAGASARSFYNGKGNKVWDMTFNFVVNVIHLWTETWNPNPTEVILGHPEDQFRLTKIPLYPSTDFSKIL